MKLCCSHHKTIENQQAEQIGAEEENQTNAYHSRQGQLSDMKPRRCRHIHVQITMMDPVKSPEQGHFMVEEMPDIGDKIQNDHRYQHLDPVGHVDDIQDTGVMMFPIG